MNRISTWSCSSCRRQGRREAANMTNAASQYQIRLSADASQLNMSRTGAQYQDSGGLYPVFVS